MLALQRTSTITFARSVFIFDGAAGSTQVVPLVQCIDATTWSSFTLTVRLYDQDAWSPTVLMQVIVENVSIDQSEPQTTFVGASWPGESRKFDYADVTPMLDVTDSFSSVPVGPMLRISLRWDQGATTGGPQTVTLGVDLLGRLR